MANSLARNATLVAANENVIYDNDTTLELIKPIGPLKLREHNPKVLRDFVDTGDSMLDTATGAERDQLASCALLALESNATLGQVNLWQAVNARGPLHMSVRFRLAANLSAAANSSRPSRRRRESFRIPIETASGDSEPDDSAAGCKRAGSSAWRRYALRSNSTPLGYVLAEPDGGQAALEVDAELLVANFRLAELVDKELALEAAGCERRPVARCQVKLVERVPALGGEPDARPDGGERLEAGGALAATRLELLPERLRNPLSSGSPAERRINERN